MFNNYIDKYFALLNLSESDNDVNLSEAVGSMNLTKSLKKFISCEINRIVILTTDSIRNQTLFDQTNDDLLRIINKLEDELSGSIRMSSFEFKQMLKNIIGLRYNYICRPLTTLTAMIYKNETEVSVNDIQNYMEYFNEYHYLLEGFTEWCEDNLDTSFLSKSEYEVLLKEIDDNYIYNLEEQEFLELLQPIFKVFSFDGLQDEVNEELPIEALIIYFSEKGISQILNILENEFENNSLVVSYEKISGLILDLVSGSEDTSTEDNFEEVEVEFSNEETFSLDDLDEVDEVDEVSLDDLESEDDGVESGDGDGIEGLEYFSGEESEEGEIETFSLDDLDEVDEVSLDDLESEDDGVESGDGDGIEELEYFSGEESEEGEIETFSLDDLDEVDEVSLDDLESEDDGVESGDGDGIEELEYFSGEESEEGEIETFSLDDLDEVDEVSLDDLESDNDDDNDFNFNDEIKE